MVTTPRSTEAIHLLRALYRQASCFFDDQARAYLRTQIRSRFKKSQKIVSEHRQSRLLKNGRNVLSTLQRANDGDSRRSLRILGYAYGQSGVRRHELMKPLLVSTPQEPLISGDRRTAKPQPSAMLKALMAASKGRYYKETKPNIPATNDWGRPFPPKREANLLWRYHTRTIKKLPTPISDDEMVKLDKFARREEQPVAPKRTHVVQKIKLQDDSKCYIQKMTPRLKSRMYQQLLKDIPIIKWNEKHGWWKVSWQPHSMRTNDGSKVLDSFAGLDARGRIIMPSKL